MSSDAAIYRQVIESVIVEYADFFGQKEGIEQAFVFDRDRDRYLLIETGWQRQKRIYSPLIHMNIKADKVWIQQDGTEDGIAIDLEAAGIPKDKIVLAYMSLERRKITEYAVS